MAAAVDVPLIADADNGYGGVLNVVRAVQEFERAGCAGIQLEDQVFPKRCGHMEGKELILKDEMTAKIRAAIHARRNKDTVIIARTDARAVNGFDDAAARAQAYSDAGADVIFFEAPESVEEMKNIARLIKTPLLVNMVEKGKTPFLTGKELEALGYKIVIYPASTLYAATRALTDMLAALKRDDTTSTYSSMVGFAEFNDLIGLQKFRDLEKSFL
jgi:2-methylisocitrate lyase-like PEP mutase family enzyme